MRVSPRTLARARRAAARRLPPRADQLLSLLNTCADRARHRCAPPGAAACGWMRSLCGLAAGHRRARAAEHVVHAGRVVVAVEVDRPVLALIDLGLPEEG